MSYMRTTVCSVVFGFALLASGALAQPHPADIFGFTPGDDYKLASYAQLVEYFEALDRSSDRVELQRIGTSVLGRPLLLAIISSEDNLRSLSKWRSASETLARARVDEETARTLADEGKAIVWIDGGLHATEVAGAQMTPLLAHRVATEESAEMRLIRDNVILLLMPVMNPDGLDIVASWYRHTLGSPFEATNPPWLYHYYVGHDNNRDWFMNNMPESEAVTEILYNKWYPQIVYNHHQTSPRWTRIFLPPFADPVNPRIHPGVTTGVNLVGTAMANRFAMKEMPGVVSGVIYSMWWNGGMRTVPYFHNMVGILTETGHATPSPRFFDPDSLPPSVGGRRGQGHPTSGTNILYPYPWKGGPSHFRDPVRYMITGSVAVLRLAADRREQWLFNIWQMGRNAIERDDSVRAYVLPAVQWNQGEELALVNLLRTGGVEIERATGSFEAGGKTYQSGSFVIPTAQPFRPYVEDLLEPQEYPDRRTAGGAPEVPYDLAGWTLPMQMGVRVDRIMDDIEASTEPVTENVVPAPGLIHGEADYGYMFSHRPNRSVLATNRLLASGESVFLAGDTLSAGSFVVKARRRTDGRVRAIAAELGMDFDGLAEQPAGPLHELEAPRIGLYKSWIANMDEGWTRWLLEEYAFAVDTLHDANIRTADLSVYHAIVLPHQRADAIFGGHDRGMMPDPYTGGLGLEGALALKRYVENGGTVVALDGASDFLIDQFRLPVENVVASLSQREFFIPGSLVRIDVDIEHALAWGMQPEATASFVRSRAFEILKRPKEGEGGVMEFPDAPAPPIDVVATYSKDNVLMSGWALGAEKHLGGKAAVLRVRVGAGNVVLFGFRPQFRGQPRGTYKLFFNALHLATLEAWPDG